MDEGYQIRCLVRNLKKAAFLKEWGAELVRGDLCDPEKLATCPGRGNGSDRCRNRSTDRFPKRERSRLGWQSGADSSRESCRCRTLYILFNSRRPEISASPADGNQAGTELFLAESGLNYTILKPCGFMQGSIGQYAIPILENQAVWITGETSPVAFMDTQDVAKFAVRAISVPEAENKAFPIVGTRAWSADEIIRLCERLSGQQAKVTRLPLLVLRGVRNITRFFQWGWNVADRLAFAEVVANGKPLNAEMDEVYQVFGLNPQETTTLEAYLQDYYSRIMKKLKELDYEKGKLKKQNKQNKRKVPF